MEDRGRGRSLVVTDAGDEGLVRFGGKAGDRRKGAPRRGSGRAKERP